MLIFTFYYVLYICNNRLKIYLKLTFIIEVIQLQCSPFDIEHCRRRRSQAAAATASCNRHHHPPRRQLSVDPASPTCPRASERQPTIAAAPY